MKAFITGLLCSVLIAALLFSGALIYLSRQAQDPENLFNNDISEFFSSQEEMVVEEAVPVREEEIIRWIPVDLSKENDLSGITKLYSKQRITGETGDIWYEIDGFVIEEIQLKDHITSPGLEKNAHTKYIMVKANYHAVNNSENERDFYIEKAWITDTNGRRHGSALTNDQQKGTRYEPKETKTGILRYQVPVYDLSSLKTISMFVDRVYQDPISGDISHRIIFSEY